MKINIQKIQTYEADGIGYWDASEPRGWGLDWHRKEGVEFNNFQSYLKRI